MDNKIIDVKNLSVPLVRCSRIFKDSPFGTKHMEIYWRGFLLLYHLIFYNDLTWGSYWGCSTCQFITTDKDLFNQSFSYVCLRRIHTRIRSDNALHGYYIWQRKCTPVEWGENYSKIWIRLTSIINLYI